ncbi:MAG: phosphotransferase [Oscillospiraceae bacterium]|nr:phosphotransferase [Oscillospiraceae bacterium]
MKTRTNHLLSQVAELYPFDVNTIRLINSDKYSPNDIYSFTKDNKKYILRIATHSENNLFKTTGEMEWLAFLHERSIPVSMPLPMKNGQLVESLISSDNKYHAVCTFEKAKGKHCEKNNPNTWNQYIIEDWGYVMGCMHFETKDFQVSDSRYMRGVFDGKDIDGSDILEKVFSQIPDIQKYADNLIPNLLSLPRTKDTYGLIHNDMHQNNFLVKNNKVHVFDFDDSIYGYFALDIGIALQHALHNADGNQSKAEKIIYSFMQGYKKANTLDTHSLKSILSFMKYRQLCNFAWCYPDNVGKNEQENILNGLTVRGCLITEEMFII